MIELVIGVGSIILLFAMLILLGSFVCALLNPLVEPFYEEDEYVHDNDRVDLNPYTGEEIPKGSTLWEDE